MEINSYFCEKCNYITKRKSNYDRHLDSNKHKICMNEKISQYKCKLCYKSYDNFESLRRHLNRNHSSNNADSNNVNNELIKMMSVMVKETCNLAKQVCELNKQNLVINNNTNNTNNTNNYTNNNNNITKDNKSNLEEFSEIFFILFCYDLFDLTHNCLNDLFNNGYISEKNKQFLINEIDK